MRSEAYETAGCLSGVEGISDAVMSPTGLVSVLLLSSLYSHPLPTIVIIDLVVVVAETSEDTAVAVAEATDRKAPRNLIFERSV